MQLEGNTVLVIGGNSGIGLELAKRFLKAGSDVTVVGRRADLLAQVAKENPGLKTRTADVADRSQREQLAAWAQQQLPKLNVVFNNAGVMKFPKLAEAKWEDLEAELNIDFTAAVHLSVLFAKPLAKNKGTLVNTTSGLAYVPLAATPIYCASKAALHSFTVSLRHQLKDSGLKVLELAPPKVDTDLAGPGAGKGGMPLDAFIDVAVEGLKRDDETIATGFSKQGSEAGKAERAQLFQALNSHA